MALGGRSSQKATFLISKEVLEEAKELVNQGAARSLNAFVEYALEEQIRRLRQAQIDRAIQEASRDPLFLADVQDTMRAFAHADAETADCLEKWLTRSARSTRRDSTPLTAPSAMR